MSDKNPNITVVTTENYREFQLSELNRLVPAKDSAEDIVVSRGKVDDKTMTTEESKEIEKKVESKTEKEIKTEVKDEKTTAVDNKAPEKELVVEEVKKSTINDRIRELSDQAKIERQRRVELEQQIEQLKKQAPLEKKEEPSADLKPTRDKFQDPFEYAEKLSEWNVREARRQWEADQIKQRETERENTVKENWLKRVAQTRKETPDFDDRILASTVTFSDPVKAAIMQSDIGPQMLLHYADNPEEAESLGRMTVGDAYLALGELRAILKTAKTKTVSEVKEEKKEPEVVKKPAVEVSKAPEPITPLKPSGATNVPEFKVETGTTYSGNSDTARRFREDRRSGKLK